MDQLSSATPQPAKTWGTPFAPGVSGCPGGAFGLTPELRLVRAAAQTLVVDPLYEMRNIAVDRRRKVSERINATRLLLKACGPSRALRERAERYIEEMVA